MSTHVVRPGETLSAIAAAYGITLARLVEANPRFAADPDAVRAGEILHIPRAPDGAPPGGERVLGALSERFETSGRGPGTVSSGIGDAGGVSYGSYQMTSRPDGGTVAKFVAHPDFPFASVFAGLTPGSVEFSSAWIHLADTRRREFQAAQHAFIKRTHFDPLVRRILADDGLDVLGRPHVVHDVVWSTAVQHGPATGIPRRALATVTVAREHADFDRDCITAIYAERGRQNASGELVHFRRNSVAVQRGVAARFREELRLALAMLDEGAGV